MAHFAKLDENNIVVQVVVVHNDVATTEQAGVDFLNDLYKTNDVWKQTSYNTRGGVHLLGGTPFRKNYAGKGMVYDEVRDAFIYTQPYPSHTLNETTCQWDAPIPKPASGDDPDSALTHRWDEELYQSDNTQGWVVEPRE